LLYYPEQVYDSGVVLEALEAALDEVGGTDPALLGDGQSMEVLQRCLSRLAAITIRATGAFDAGGDWEANGARSAAAWLAVRCSLPPACARRRVRLGRELRHLPVAEGAWLAGEVGEAQVAALAGARTPATEQAMARDEAMLVDQAAKLRHDGFVRVLAYWSQCADPDGTEEDAAEQCQARRFHLSQSFGGTWLGDLVLDPVNGAVVANQLSRIEQELFEADWAHARSERGQDACGADLGRTPSQRRADALVEMARLAGSADPGARRPEPLFTVLVGYETFAGRICELANGTVVSPGALVPWLEQAWVERVVFDGASRVIDVGAARRLFAGATRRAVQVRDRECFHPYCDQPAQACQVDHVEPWGAGGRTVAANGRPACAHHNRDRHRNRPP